MWRRWFYCPEKMPDDTIDIDLEVDGLDITPTGSKATCQEPKDFIHEMTGRKVFSPYTSQVKRKCPLSL